ncbi:hypothetical protein Lauda_00083 [Pseudomonas phage vB_PpuM-Lauda]
MWIDYVWGYKLFGGLYETVRVKFQSEEMDKLDNVFLSETDARKAVETLNYKRIQGAVTYLHALNKLDTESVQGEQAVYNVTAGYGEPDACIDGYEDRLLLRAKTACLIRFDRRITQNSRNIPFPEIL